MSSTESAPAAAINLSNCDREPIHTPGSVQEHGCALVFAVSPGGELVVEQATENSAAFLGMPLDRILGRTALELFGSELAAEFGSEFETRRDVQTNHFLRSVALPSGMQVEIVTHLTNGLLVAEFERADMAIERDILNTTVVNVVAHLESLHDIPDLGRVLTREIRTLTQFDRVLMYVFDEAGNGTVIAEDGNDNLPPMLHLRFPAADIPQQARRLYLLNRVRIIPDVEYTPSPLVARHAADEPLDMTYSVLRSVSPVHRDYMRNMGTAASMSISLVVDGRLWGMVSCHNAAAKTVAYTVRSACEMLTRIVAAQIGAHVRAADYAEAIRLKAIERDLLTYMALEEKYLDGITNHPEKVLALTKATGAAFVLDDACVLMGETPTEAQVKALAEWLASRQEPEFFSTDSLAEHYAAASGFSDIASGLISISLSQIHHFQILWFRPEILRTIEWAGEPQLKIGDNGSRLNISPRTSFGTWSELVRGHSEPWTKVERDAARDFRNAVLLIVLRRAEELADMAAELEFANKELEAFSYSVSHDLRAPFRHISGFAELLLTDESEGLSERGRGYLNRIAESAKFAGQLVDSLLNFSQIARTRLEQRPVAMTLLVREVWEQVRAQEMQGREVEFTCGELPTVEGDVPLLRQVWRNLLSNAGKYTRGRTPARIAVAAYRDHSQYIFSIRDNGVGFDNRYVHKLFGAFQRLHRVEEFEGTGIGLANVRRIVARHGGQTWAEGKLNQGASFFFSLPVPEPNRI